MADYRVRPYTTAYLKRRFLHDRSPQAAFQFRFCYKIGFDVVKEDDMESNTSLSQSSHLQNELDHEIQLCIDASQEPLFRLGGFRDPWFQGHIPIEESQSYAFESQQLHEFEIDHRREILDALDFLGNSN